MIVELELAAEGEEAHRLLLNQFEQQIEAQVAKSQTKAPPSAAPSSAPLEAADSQQASAAAAAAAAATATAAAASAASASAAARSSLAPAGPHQAAAPPPLSVVAFLSEDPLLASDPAFLAVRTAFETAVAERRATHAEELRKLAKKTADVREKIEGELRSHADKMQDSVSSRVQHYSSSERQKGFFQKADEVRGAVNELRAKYGLEEVTEASAPSSAIPCAVSSS